jgi:hypothetical protein
LELKLLTHEVETTGLERATVSCGIRDSLPATRAWRRMRSYDLTWQLGRVPVEASVRLGDPNVNASGPPPGVGVSGCRVGGGELRAEEHQRRLGVVRLRNRGQRELGDRAWPKDEAVGRAAELEVT